MTSYAEYTKNQIGLSYSTARSKLIKSVLFDLVKQCGKNICYRCDELIIDIKHFSIDHKTEWLNKENAKELYFDVSNVAFSHLSCNSRAARCDSTVRGKTGYKGVTLSKCKKKYIARVGKKDVGRFETPKEAALAYDKKAIEEFGDRAVTNKMLGLIK